MISVLYFFLVNFAVQTNKSIKFYINILCLSTSIIFTSCSLVVDPQKIKDVDVEFNLIPINTNLITYNSIDSIRKRKSFFWFSCCSFDIYDG